MIKIAVFNVGRGMYAAFSINQEYPLGTILKAPTASKEEIERILIVRFHSQRNEYKKQGKRIEPIDRNGTLRGGWKFTWWPTSILWKENNSIITQTREEVLVNEPGLTITKKTPLAKEMGKALFDANEITGKIVKEKMVMAECKDGKFSFTPVTEDIIGISQIPEYISKHTEE